MAEGEQPSYPEAVGRLNDLAARLVDLLNGGYHIPDEYRPPPGYCWTTTMILRRVVFELDGARWPGV